eukprot:GHVS01053666.1.p1 GENE.GHVS01053666.1~~GHVS01053666.1.p1  ORF type:complete len:373 (-),score=55.14 GHVS01053666.1:623-1741(-)
MKSIWLWLFLCSLKVQCCVSQTAEQLKQTSESSPKFPKEKGQTSSSSFFPFADISLPMGITASTEEDRQNKEFLRYLVPFSPLPLLPIKGQCPLNRQYFVTSPTTLLRLSQELDCLFHVAVPPGSIPIGPTFGYVLSLIGTSFYSLAVDKVYDGHFFAQTTCDFGRRTVGLVQSRVAMTGPTLGWAYTIGEGDGSRRTLEEAAKDIQTVEGELFDLREGDLVKDYRADVCSMCPVEVQAKWVEKEGGEIFGDGSRKGKIQGTCTEGGYDGLFPFDISLTAYPLNRFVDVVRAIGRDKTDGGLLLLGRTLFVPKTGQPGSTILYFLLKTFNPEVLPGFSPAWTQSTGPIPLSFMRQGAVGLVKQLFFSSAMGL